MGWWVLGFQDIENTQLMLVGGKGLNLGDLSKIQGIKVPEGIYVTTVGYQKAIETKWNFSSIVESTNNANVKDRDQIRDISRKIRQIIKEVEIPTDIACAVADYLCRVGAEHS